jgi:hypothetical protein
LARRTHIRPTSLTLSALERRAAAAAGLAANATGWIATAGALPTLDSITALGEEWHFGFGDTGASVSLGFRVVVDLSADPAFHAAECHARGEHQGLGLGDWVGIGNGCQSDQE